MLKTNIWEIDLASSESPDCIDVLDWLIIFSGSQYFPLMWTQTFKASTAAFTCGSVIRPSAEIIGSRG